MQDEISDDDLLKLVVEADDEAFANGSPPNSRSLVVIPQVMKKLGYQGFALFGPLAPPILHRVKRLHDALYRQSDLAMGGVHGGIFMFRDVFARITVPIIMGMAAIKPFELTDLSPLQIQWLASRPSDRDALISQFVNVFDFGGGIANLAEYKKPPENALAVFRLAAFQLQAAAATLSVAFNFGGAVQSALIGAELALKGGLAAVGHDEKSRESFGHNLSKAAMALSEAKPGFDRARVLAAVGKLPPYVKNRYSIDQPGRVETGQIVMNAQFIAGEVMRSITEYSIASGMKQSSQVI